MKTGIFLLAAAFSGVPLFAALPELPYFSEQEQPDESRALEDGQGKEEQLLQDGARAGGEPLPPGDPRNEALGCATPCAVGILEAPHPYYDVYISCFDGSFTARTGASHSVTLGTGLNQNVIYGGSFGSPGTSDISFYIHDIGMDINNPPNGGACLFNPPDTPNEPNNVGIEMEWVLDLPTLGSSVVLREEIVAFGDTEENSGIRLTLGATNEPSSANAVTLGVRWQIDYQNAEDDGPWFAWVECDPFHVGPERFTEHEFSPPEVLDFYRIRNNMGSVIFENYTSTVSLPGFSDTGTPDRIIYAYWGRVVNSMWGYAASEGDISPDMDSAVLYYYGYDAADGIVLAPGESFRRSVVLFTSGRAQDCQLVRVCAGDAGPDIEVCEGDTPVDLDGAGSTFAECNGDREYRWLEGGVPIRDWSDDPFITVTPLFTTTYTLEVRCMDGIEVVCESWDEVTVFVIPLPGVDAGPDILICAGATAFLDGAATVDAGCASVWYRWLEDGTSVQDWSDDPALTAAPPSTTVYTLEVRCVLDDGTFCMGFDQITVNVQPLPTAIAGPDVSVCENRGLRLDGSASLFPLCRGARQYQWSLGAVIVQSWAGQPVLSRTTGLAGTESYSLEVRCEGTPDCLNADQVDVEVMECSTAVEFLSYGARRSDEGVEVYWTTVMEDHTMGFIVEGRMGEDGEPRPAHAGIVPSRGGGSTYSVVVADPCWIEYRVRELASQGPPVLTPFFAVRSETEEDRAVGRDRGGSRNR